MSDYYSILGVSRGASDDDINYIYNYLEQLLAEKIEETKVYYNQHNYNYQIWN